MQTSTEKHVSGKYSKLFLKTVSGSRHSAVVVQRNRPRERSGALSDRARRTMKSLEVIIKIGADYFVPSERKKPSGATTSSRSKS
jgi:hypothetical protein